MLDLERGEEHVRLVCDSFVVDDPRSIVIYAQHAAALPEPCSAHTLARIIHGRAGPSE